MEVLKDNEYNLLVEREYNVVKANEIIQRARYDLGVTELKALAFIFSKIKPTDTELKEYEFSIKEYCLVCGLDETSGGNYAQVKKSLKKLRDTSFWLIDETGRETTVGWLEKARISKGSGKISVKPDQDLQKYLIALQANFTQYALLYTLPMRSAYSFRIYELLKSYAFQHEKTYNIDELKYQLLAQHYVNFKDFRKKVIEVAVKEINQYTDIEVQWEPISKGRKVVQVKFTIRQRDSMGNLEASDNALKQISRRKQIEGQASLDQYLSVEE